MQLLQCAEDLFRLIVGNDTRQNRNRGRPSGQERKNTAVVLGHHRSRCIQEMRLQCGQFRCKLFRGCNLENRLRFSSAAAILRCNRHRETAALRRGHPLLRKLGNQLAAQFIDFSGRQKQPFVRFRLVLHHRKGSAAGFIHLFNDVICGNSLPLGTFRNRAECRRTIPVIIKGNGFCTLALLHQRIKMNRHAAYFTRAVCFPRISIERIDLFIRLGLDAEHVGFVAVQIALGKALPGERSGKQFHLIRCRVSFFLQEFGVHTRHNAGVLGTLHAPLNLHAGDAGLFQGLQAIGKTVVLQGKRIVVHPATQGILHPAGLRAHPAVAAAPADHGGHVTLPGMAEAKSAVYEHFGFRGAVFADKADFLQTEFPCQDNTRHAKLRRSFRPGEIVDAHLRTGMQRNVRHRAAQHLCKSEILDQDRVCALF